MAVEADSDQAVIWTKPADLDYSAALPRAGLGGLRPGGFQVLLGDGSVRLIADSTDLDAVRALFTPNGREPMPDGF
jgi:hypothetical protein